MAKNLREEYDALTAATEQLIAKARDEDRDLTDEERAENESRFGRMKQINNLSADSKRLADAKAVEVYTADEKAGLAGGSVEPTPGAGDDADEPFAKLPVPPHRQSSAERQKYARESAALVNYIRTGDRSHEQYTLTTGSGGGVLVPATVLAPIVVRYVRNPILPALAAYGYDVIRTDTTEPLKIPILDDTANAATLIAEDAQTDNPTDVNVSGSITLSGAKLLDSGTEWMSGTLLRANGFDLLAYVKPLLYQRLERYQASTWFTQLAASSNVYTAAGTTTVTYADVNNFYFSLSAPYRDDAAFFVSDGFLQTITNLVDTMGRPLYRQSMRDGVPDTLLGKPLFVTTAAALGAPAAGVVVAAFVSMSTVKVRLVNNQELITYVNIPTKPGEIGLRVLQNGDFGFAPQGVALLKMHA